MQSGHHSHEGNSNKTGRGAHGLGMGRRTCARKYAAHLSRPCLESYQQVRQSTHTHKNLVSNTASCYATVCLESYSQVRQRNSHGQQKFSVASANDYLTRSFTIGFFRQKVKHMAATHFRGIPALVYACPISILILCQGHGPPLKPCSTSRRGPLNRPPLPYLMGPACRPPNAQRRRPPPRRDS